jgi:predicted HicB family RNase H-like nuclease
MMTYKGYVGAVELDLDAGILHGHVVGTRTVITFWAERADQIEQEFHTSVDVHLESCAERGETPETPFSGTLSFRTTPEIHQRIAAAAQAAGKSINTWMEETIIEALARVQPSEGTREPILVPLA